MIVLRLVPALILHLILAGPLLIMPTQLYAGVWCCPCGTECSVLNLGSWFCTCPGISKNCPYCEKSDSTTFQAKPLTGNGMSDIGSVPGSVSSTVMKSDLKASMVGQMRGGKCAANKFSLRLLANAADGLIFEPASFNENSIRDQTLAFHTTPEK